MVNVLNDTESFTLKGLILGSVNFTLTTTKKEGESEARANWSVHAPSEKGSSSVAGVQAETQVPCYQTFQLFKISQKSKFEGELSQFLYVDNQVKSLKISM